MGASFINTFDKNGHIADFVYDESGQIIGSKGWYQEVLSYVISHLNLTVQTRNSQGQRCIILAHLNLTDLCSGGETTDVSGEDVALESFGITNTGAAYSLPIHHTAHTMLAGVPEGGTSNIWMYLKVFGTKQWMLFFLMLLISSVGTTIIDIVWNIISKDIQTHSMLEGFVMVSLFSIQQGSHPDGWQIKAKRILALTTSVLTLLIFIYYGNDITAEMTAGPPPISVHSFGDVLNGSYKVIVMKESHVKFLALTAEVDKERNREAGAFQRCLELDVDGTRGCDSSSIIRSAQNSVYMKHFHEDNYKIRDYEYAVECMNIKPEDQNQKLMDMCKNLTANIGNADTSTSMMEEIVADMKKELPQWYKAQNTDWAIEKITSDQKYLIYCPDKSCDQQGNIRKGIVTPFEMEDAQLVYYAFLLRIDSEYLPLFNHYLLKAFETGILQRLENFWNADFKPPIKVGINEPQPLEMFNVMFPFSLLAATMVISVVVTISERVVYAIRVRYLIPKSIRGGGEGWGHRSGKINTIKT